MTTEVEQTENYEGIGPPNCEIVLSDASNVSGVNELNLNNAVTIGTTLKIEAPENVHYMSSGTHFIMGPQDATTGAYTAGNLDTYGGNLLTKNLTATGTLSAEALRISQGPYGNVMNGLYFGLLSGASSTVGTGNYLVSISGTASYYGQIVFQSVNPDAGTQAWLQCFGGTTGANVSFTHTITNLDYGYYNSAGTWVANTASNGVYTFRIQFSVGPGQGAPGKPVIYWLAIQT